MRDYATHHSWDEPKVDKNARIRWIVIAVAAALLIVLYAISHHHKKSAASATVVKAQAAAKASAQKSQKPVQFDFYQMLTKNQPGSAAPAAAAAAKAVTPVQTYFVQIGDLYATKGAAEQQKANLILAGVASNLIKITPAGSNQFKVTLGPYDDMSIAKAEQANLTQNKISGALIKGQDLKK